MKRQKERQEAFWGDLLVDAVVVLACEEAGGDEDLPDANEPQQWCILESVGRLGELQDPQAWLESRLGEDRVDLGQHLHDAGRRKECDWLPVVTFLAQGFKGGALQESCGHIKRRDLLMSLSCLLNNHSVA